MIGRMVLAAAELGHEARRRRVAMGLTQTDVVDASRAALGPKVLSEPTYRALETGRTEATGSTLAAASIGLGGPPDALARIRDGVDPDEAWAQRSSLDDDDHETRLAAVEKELAEIKAEMAREQQPILLHPPDEIDKIEPDLDDPYEARIWALKKGFPTDRARKAAIYLWRLIRNGDPSGEVSETG